MHMLGSEVQEHFREVENINLFLYLTYLSDCFLGQKHACYHKNI